MDGDSPRGLAMSDEEGGTSDHSEGEGDSEEQDDSEAEDEEDQEEQDDNEVEDANEEEEDSTFAASSGYASRKESKEEVETFSLGKRPPAVSPSHHASCKKRASPTRVAKENEPTFTSPWIDQILSSIRDAHCHITRRKELLAHPSPDSFVPHLRKVRTAAWALLTCTDEAISCAHTMQAMKEKIALRQELATAQKELEKSQSQYSSQVTSLQLKLEMQKEGFLKQKREFQRQENTLNNQKIALMAEQRALERLLEEEKDKSICCVCHDKPRDTIILPCLHFQYCFGCLLRHREVNSNTCPSCRGPIQGLSMSSYLAGQ